MSNGWSGLHASLHLPVFPRTVVAVGANLLIAILPGIVAELGRVFELLLRNIGAEAAERLVVSESGPGNRIVAVAETQEAAKAHDGVSDGPDSLSMMR